MAAAARHSPRKRFHPPQAMPTRRLVPSRTGGAQRFPRKKRLDLCPYFGRCPIQVAVVAVPDLPLRVHDKTGGQHARAPGFGSARIAIEKERKLEHQLVGEVAGYAPAFSDV